MPDYVWYDALADNDVMRDAIKKLKEEKEMLVEESFSKIKKLNPRYLQRITDEEDFKDSVLQHIEWILKDMFNPEKVNFNKYNASSLKNVPQAYCEMYKYIIELTNNIDYEIKEIWHDYFNSFREMYSCRD